MALTFNSNNVSNVEFNGENVGTIWLDGQKVWEKSPGVVNLAATASTWRNSSSTNPNTATITLPASGGYGRITFEPHSMLGYFTKATLHFYITANASRVYAYPRLGSMADPSYNTGFGSGANKVWNGNGWCEYDITNYLKELLDTYSELPAAGVKVFFTSPNNTRISTHLGDYPPYITLE